jgi:hypothetical protein
MITASQASALAACCYGSLLLCLCLALLAGLGALAARASHAYRFAAADRLSDLNDAISWVTRHEGAYLLPLKLRVQLAASIVRGTAEPCYLPDCHRSSAFLAVLVALLLPAITATAAGASDHAKHLTDHASTQKSHAKALPRAEAPAPKPQPAEPSQPKCWAITGNQRRSRKGALARVPRGSRDPRTGSQGATSSPAGSYGERWWRSHGALTSQANEFARLWGLHLDAPAAPPAPATTSVFTMAGVVYRPRGWADFRVYGPYPNKGTAYNRTAYVQGNLHLREWQVPAWFAELVAEEPDSRYLRHQLEALAGSEEPGFIRFVNRSETVSRED